MAERGKWVRGFGCCGSGKEGWEMTDKMNVYAGIYCVACEASLRARSARGILPGDDEPYDVDEQIEEDRA